MPSSASSVAVQIRPMSEMDIDGIVRIDEKVSGKYRPDVWEKRLTYYIRRDPAASQVAVSNGRVVGFMMGEVRGGEFGLEEPTGWVEYMGVDPHSRGQSVGRKLAEALFAHFQSRGAQVARTVVTAQQKDIAKFLGLNGFGTSALTILEKRPL